MMKLKNNKYAKDMRPLDENCGCMVCKQYTRSYLYHTIRAQGTAAPAILITYHNVAYMQVRAQLAVWTAKIDGVCRLCRRFCSFQ